MANVLLKVWVEGKVHKVQCASHQEASRLARGIYAGFKTQVKNVAQRQWHESMRSYSDKMAREYY